MEADIAKHIPTARPLFGSTSHRGCDVKQITVRTTISDSEVIIITHQKEGWRLNGNIPQCGGEILLIFEK